MRKIQQGFTLIELLVVIAIIAILAAVLFPVFMMAKSRAGMAACQSNMKQLGAAMLMYADNSNGYLPMSHRGQAWVSDSADQYWGRALSSYCAKKADVCYCPSIPPKWGSWNSSPGWKYYWGTSIGMNVALGHDGTTNSGSTTIPACRVESIRVPTRTIALGDSSLYAYPGYGKAYGHWAICPPAGTTLGSKSYLNPWPAGFNFDFFDPERHKGMVNIACADGHVVAKERKWLLGPHASNAQESDYTWWDKF